MLSIQSLIGPEEIKKLASRSNLRYGEKMSEDATISFTDTNTFNIHAKLSFGTKTHMVELASTTKGFRWKCSCSSKKNFFCEHATAVALAWNTRDPKKG